MKRIYFAGPLFCEGEKIFNEMLTNVFEEAGYEVFLPQRDGIIAAELIGKTEEETVRIVFEKDTGEIRKCDVLVFVTDGRVPDDGGCAELGIAYALGKTCYGIRTDVRALENNMPLNPLIAGCFKKTFANPDGKELIAELKEWLKDNEL